MAEHARRFPLIAAGLLVVFAILPASAAPLSGRALVEALRQGGTVIVMRHASSPPGLPDKSIAEPDNTKPERQLDQKGRETARAMGAAIRKLGVPVGAIFSSPTYRALETVRIAGLGTPTSFAQLGDGGSSMSSQAVAAWASWLRMKVAERPRAGANTIIVTHMPNIVAAFPDEAKGLADGTALVFRPDGQGHAQWIARVEIADWPDLAARP